jgi:hypothetical protein
VSTNTFATISATYNNSTKTAALAVQAATPTSFVLSPNTVIGGNHSIGTVALNGPVPAGAVVNLSSSNPAVGSVPGSVAVSGTTATFTVTTHPVSTTTSMTVSAAYGGITTTATLTVQSGTLVSLTLNPTSPTGGNHSIGTVTLSGPAPAGGAVVALSSSNPSVASVPHAGSVTVPSGAATATAVLSTHPVSTTTPVTIYARYAGVTRTATLSVKPPALVSIEVNPASVTHGTNSTATVTLSGPAPAGGVVVALSSSNTAAATVPASVTVSGVATAANATVSTKAVSSRTVVNVIAKYAGVTKSATLTVR